MKSLFAEPAAGRRRLVPRRVGVLTALAGLLSALAVVVSPVTAQAADPYPCTSHTDRGDYHRYFYGYDDESRENGWLLVVYWLRYWEPRFDVAGSATEGNDSEIAQAKTFNITTSENHTVADTRKSSGSDQVTFIKDVLSRTSSWEHTQQLTHSYTTSSSVTYTETLNPHTARRVYNGVDAVFVRFDVAVWRYSEGKCWWRSSLTEYNVERLVPSTSERRDVKAVPTINPGGVNDEINNDGNVRPGEVITVRGEGFLAANRIILRQNGRMWIVGAGSGGWYESYNQINFQMPYDVTPGQYVSVSVESNLTVDRSETLWPREVFVS